ncbi:MAG TPA: riboflavin synthase [Woeseiaceae bacterium]|nr:riboflavin synthase [Woeseiaceae bacterium]
MFTGIIKARGEVTALTRPGGDARLEILADDLPWANYETGDSISVNGVCLTAAPVLERGFVADVSRETLAVTTLGTLQRGSLVNLEPALAVGERLGGHLVSGHVDCIGFVKAVTSDARSTRLNIEVPLEYARYIAKKGSICVDGVSLTINEVSGNTFASNIIPHTAEVTTLGLLKVGDKVNIEVDQLARYLERLISKDAHGLSEEFLRNHGYA